MTKINLLSSEIYNLISAGEVIETPVGALKEIVENSIDAGAMHISIEVEEGGFGLIKVTDDGTGMAEDDIDLAFYKHATSKISNADDLFKIGTLGFRGEALPSIAAVSKVKLTSRNAFSDVATSVCVENGKIISKTYTSTNVGTSIEVKDLFYNTPARKKFFKTPQREGAEITRFVSRLILTNPNLAIDYSIDGKEVYRFAGDGLEKAIYQVYGYECHQNLIAVCYLRDDVVVKGFIGTPDYSKPNRTYQTLSVNGRYVVDANVSGAILQAYKPYLMTKKYPFFVLDVKMPVDKVDVNVHPKKSEVRFADSHFICGTAYHAVEEALKNYSQMRVAEILKSTSQEEEKETQTEQGQDNELITLAKKYAEENFKGIDVSFENVEEENMTKAQLEAVIAIEHAQEELVKTRRMQEFLKSADEEISVQQARERMGFVSADEDAKNGSTTVTKKKPVEVQENFLIKEDNCTEDDFAMLDRCRILGAAFNTYLILEFEGKIIFVDQHAAHERILFEKYMKALGSKHLEMERLMVPYVFTVKSDEAEFIERNLPLIKKAGIKIDSFGVNTFRIVEVASILKSFRMLDFVEFLLSQIENFKLDDQELIINTVATQACRAAVKAGETLNEEEIIDILKAVVENRLLQCPHGRPITILLTKKDLEKMFKRIV